MTVERNKHSTHYHNKPDSRSALRRIDQLYRPLAIRVGKYPQPDLYAPEWPAALARTRLLKRTSGASSRTLHKRKRPHHKVRPFCFGGGEIRGAPPAKPRGGSKPPTSTTGFVKRSWQT